MKILIKKTDMLNALTYVQSVVEKKTLTPILSNVLLQAKRDKLFFSATDLDIGIQDAAEAEIEKEGIITVPAHTLYDICKKLPDDSSIQIETNYDNTLATIKSGRSKFNLGCLSPNEFPEMESAQTNGQITLDSNILKDMLENVKFAISSDETRYYLNGIYLHTKNINNKPYLCAVSTDGHRLAKYETEIDKYDEFLNNGLIIPRKTVFELKKILEKANSDVTIDFSDRVIRFSFDYLVMTSKLIDGSFPDYQRVIPENNDKLLTINPVEFSKSIDRVSAVVNEKTKSLKFVISKNKLVIQASTQDSNSAMDELDVEYADDDLTIGFNPRYLLDITQLLSKGCMIYLKNVNSPAIVKDKENSKSTFVLMPVRV